MNAASRHYGLVWRRAIASTTAGTKCMIAAAMLLFALALNYDSFRTPGASFVPGAASPKLPPAFEMAVNVNTSMWKESCAPCGEAHPLGSLCCGLCGFWETSFMPGDKWHPYPWEAPCANASGLVRLLETWGVDLWGFQPAALFSALEGRTLWLIGDSQARRFYQAVECFLSPFLKTVFRVAPTNSTTANLWLMNRSRKLEGAGEWRSPPETAICAEYRNDTRVCFVRIHTAEEIAHPVLRVLQRERGAAFARDIAVINAGLHYEVGNYAAYTNDLRYLASFIAENRAALPTIFWKDTSPQHFKFDRGYYRWRSEKAQMSKECRPLASEEYQDPEIEAGGWYNLVAFEEMAAAGVPVFDTYKMTLPLWQYHMSQDDCTHYCHPSAYELWMYLLHEKLQEPRDPMQLSDEAEASEARDMDAEEGALGEEQPFVESTADKEEEMGL